MKAREIIERKIGELQNESNQVQQKLQQVNQIKSQLQTRLVQIDGSLTELNEVLKNIDVEERKEECDSECKVTERSDNDESTDNSNC